MNDETLHAPGYWAVIPAGIRYDDRIPAAAKLLYSEISSLTGAAGYCWADNAYFAQLYKITERTVRRLLDALEAQGYIRVEETRGERNVLVSRRIFAGINPLSALAGPPSDAEISLDKNVQTDPVPDLSSDKNVRSLDKNVQTHLIKEQEIITYVSADQKKQPTNRSAASWKPERFDAFWSFYRRIPGEDGRARNESKQKAARAWDALCPDDALIGRIGRALLRQMETPEWQRGVGIPMAATYLNQRRWEDAEELPEPAAAEARPIGRGKDVIEI